MWISTIHLGTALIFLIITIGLLNICLGFGLAMYYGFGPPGLDGICEALAPMPPAAPPAQPVVSGRIGLPNDPPVSRVAIKSAPKPAANLPAGSTIAPASESLAEEEVLGDVRDLAATAQAAMVEGRVESSE